MEEKPFCVTNNYWVNEKYAVDGPFLFVLSLVDAVLILIFVENYSHVAHISTIGVHITLWIMSQIPFNDNLPMIQDYPMQVFVL